MEGDFSGFALMVVDVMCVGGRLKEKVDGFFHQGQPGGHLAFFSFFADPFCSTGQFIPRLAGSPRVQTGKS